jgi:hypothetical protein
MCLIITHRVRLLGRLLWLLLTAEQPSGEGDETGYSQVPLVLTHYPTIYDPFER